MATVDLERMKRVVDYYYTKQPTTWGVAMREAGKYSKARCGQPSKWKRSPHVQKLIKRYEQVTPTGEGINARGLEVELDKIILGHRGKYLKVEADGQLKPDYTHITEDDKDLIKEVQVDEVKRADGTTSKIKTRVILHDKLAAIRLSMMSKGMFKDQVEVKGEVSLIERLQRGRKQVGEKQRDRDEDDGDDGS